MGVMAGRAPTTAPTDVRPTAFLETLDERRSGEGRVLLDLMREATGSEGVMWGPSMVGYGSFHYRSPSGGAEGTWFRVGFSPRKARITLYGLLGHPRSEELIARLGKNTVGVGCVYATRLEHLDLDVLRELAAHSFQDVTAVEVVDD
ncbi:protein of unknown function (DU1801) [Ornithinimicrobium cerasi]|uniref:YdhG-like domain-containing protein n=2 Tax=Ornithinimicrobium cerasi TaxID=2248773 RepID=A0A285VEP6_9MICO|nr:protein of unknown function (DU1801) [Ornithinimicrobium cerasi]